MCSKLEKQSIWEKKKTENPIFHYFVTPAKAPQRDLTGKQIAAKKPHANVNIEGKIYFNSTQSSYHSKVKEFMR